MNFLLPSYIWPILRLLSAAEVPNNQDRHAGRRQRLPAVRGQGGGGVGWECKKPAAAALQLQYSPPQQLVLLLASSPAAPAARPLALRTLGFRLVRVFKRRVVMAARATMFSRNMKLRCSPIASTRDNSTPSIRELSPAETLM